MIMTKRLTLVCFLLFFIVGVKAQTYCYHCYKKYDKFDVPEEKNSYKHITFKGEYMYFSEKDGSYENAYWSDNKKIESLYKYTGKKVDGALMYAYWSKWGVPFGEYKFNYGIYFLVSEDRNYINFVVKRNLNGKVVDNPYTLCYERCPNEDCEKPQVPGMKH